MFNVYGDRSFKLDSRFLNRYRGQEPQWGYGEMSRFTFMRTYSRNGETFFDVCVRVCEGVQNIFKEECRKKHLPWNNQKAQSSAQNMFQRMWEFKWLPPGRGLWMMGTDFVEKKGSAALNNCGFITTANIDKDFAGPFCWLMDMSMCGVGVGFDTEGAEQIVIKPGVKQADPWVVTIEDSREGWVTSVRLLLDAYGYGLVEPTFDYSQIRAAGLPIRGFGGVSSGPGPLKELHESLRKLLDARIGQPITSGDIVDICNLIGRCVIAGNVRRTAEIAFGAPHDEEFLELKDPDKNGEALMSHRWASNNSVLAELGMDYTKLAAQTAKNGEPGFIWLENMRDYGRMGDKPNYKDARAAGSNPCVEQTLEDRELCCLVETFPAKHEDFSDYLVTLKYAYMYAKAVTLIPTHDPYTNAVVLRNRRIGCSMSGITQAIEKFGYSYFFDQFCECGYWRVEYYDEVYSNWLCVPRSIKMTSVKPSGTVSILAGATPGIHFPHSEYYIRRVRVAKESPYVQQLIDAGYHVEPCKYGPGSMVVSFPIHEKNFGRSKDDVSMWEQLALAAKMQASWADNQVSATITFKKQEGADIAHALDYFQYHLKGISFLPLSEHGYEQAPYEKIEKFEYEALTKHLKPLDSSNGHHEVTEAFCDGDSCELPISE